MKITVKFGLGFAAFWILFKMILFMTLTGQDRYNLELPILLNILCLLLGMTVGLYFHKRNQTEESNALGDIKSAMSAGLPYTIIVSIFLFLYYNNIDPEFNRHQLTESEVHLDKMLDDPNQLKELKKSNADFEVMGKDEIRTQLLDNQQAMFSPRSVMTISLLGMLILSTINAIFVTVVFRKLIFRRT
jgi:hypothetical protein